MISFWEREHFTNYDFVVLGAGIVGCSTAYHLRQKHPNASIAILERGVFPSGASTKNAGFACFGSLTELVDDLPQLGEESLMALVEKRWTGLQKLRNTLGDKKIDYQCNGGFELIREKEMPALGKLDQFNERLKAIFQANVFKDEPRLIKQFGLSTSKIQTVVSNQFEGQINTGKMMRAWWDLCGENNIKLFTGCKIEHIDEQGEIVVLKVENTTGSDKVCFKTKQLAICTNAFAQQFLPNENIIPGRGMVMITQPVDGLKIKGVFHYDEGYFYFRNFENRLLIGGGRNLDKESEQTLAFGINEKIKAAILRDISEMILPGQDFQIDMEWSGIMAFGENKSPIVKRISDKIVVGVRLGGMGVAIGTQIGAEIQELFGD
ncbi:FAD-binding oxidoreductase [Marivirga sp. S37H4]|uniref:FAD-binding oxidoreductase n=1 Tax=Marivirga aurantiaca TaxID=2802615 RepID=A0A935C7G9_9BACT|nr:FAD-dependent oxidoreductase [Marivirga aurantiaca]MBK6264909.1 FAD-binding oxidoreductase [Marivirga aurantiaca]